MRMLLRRLLDRAFTSVAGLSVLLMSAALVLILGPILVKGMGAIFFQGTVEFRKMQLGEFRTGDADAVRAEAAKAAEARRPVYDLLDRFSEGILVEKLEDRVKDAYSQLRAQLDNRIDAGKMTGDEARELRGRTRDLRKGVQRALESRDRDEALAELDTVLASADRPVLKTTAARDIFTVAEQYRETVAAVDLSRRRQYAEELTKVSDLLIELYGPRDEDSVANLAQFRYGASRLDQTRRILDDILYTETWVQVEPNQPLEKVLTPRKKIFEGTPFEAFFGMVENSIDETMRPEFTFYWRYLTQDSTPGHFFGGVGPETVGTLMLTAVAMLLAVPVGVITAAYLVECTRENLLMRVLRTCINTLAGVPSIVFGLFGLAFFVLWLLPGLGVAKGSSVLAGALTLGVLVLPIVIRASEEAIRAVPKSYKEASLALGAGGLRTFLTVTLPAALPGILTGVILSMSRAAGETAPIIFTAAVAFGPWPDSLVRPCRALSYASYDIAVGDRLAAKVPHNQFGMILALVLLVLLLNITAILIRWRIARKLRGS